MPNNSEQDTQESAETNNNSLFSGLTLDLRTIIIGVIVTVVGTVIANYVGDLGILKRYIAYENSDYGIQLEHPKRWEIQENLGGLQPEIDFVAPLEGDADNFQERVTIGIENLSKPLSIKEYASKITAQIEASNTIIEPARTINFASKEGREIIYQEKDGNKKRREVWMIKNKQAYIATYTAETDKFNKFAQQADKIIQSIKIK